MFEGDKLINEFSVSTGAKDTPTPLGIFKIYDKFIMVNSKSSGCWLPFWAGFTTDGLYGFHEVPICAEGRRGQDQIGNPASIGCVRLSVTDSETFYKWIDVGTTVIIKNN
jgi:lipoprotein-anchoring transpeptidase ErfK/SrfK